ncbi:hypothetical protein IPL68_01075 [Candidatus Saccharibacteria bacterium]|nr:MAG: hypothetical protein IPL68_01075 [Candidatus Saccharibacteria bacterium]
MPYRALLSKQGATATVPLQTAPIGTTSLSIEGLVGDYAYVTAASGKPITLVYHLPSGSVVDQQPVTGAISGEYIQRAQPKQVEQVAQSGAGTSTQTQTQQTTTTDSATTTGGQPAQTSQTQTQQPSNGTGQSPTAQHQPTPSQQANNATTPSTQPTVAQEQTVPKPEVVIPPKAYYGALTEYNSFDKSVKRVATGSDLQPARGEIVGTTKRIVLCTAKAVSLVSYIRPHVH